MSAPIAGLSSRLAIAAVALFLAWTPARAQAPEPAPAAATAEPGSLTLLSRPPGASFRLSGDQLIVGRTPMTLARGLTGHYRIRSQEPGYEPWRRSLTLNGASADTVWMSLRPKSKAMAALRSMIVPGWGQYYGDRPSRALTWLGVAGASGTALGVAALEYRDRADRYEDANRHYQQATTDDEVTRTFQARAKAADEAENAFQVRQIALSVTAGIWALSMIDAVVTFPTPRGQALSALPGGARLGLEPHRVSGAEGWAARLRMDF